MAKGRRGKSRRKRPSIRLPVPPPGRPLGPRASRRAYDRAREREDFRRELEEPEMEEDWSPWETA